MLSFALPPSPRCTPTTGTKTRTREENMNTKYNVQCCCRSNVIVLAGAQILVQTALLPYYYSTVKHLCAVTTKLNSRVRLTGQIQRPAVVFEMHTKAKPRDCEIWEAAQHSAHPGSSTSCKPARSLFGYHFYNPIDTSTWKKIPLIRRLKGVPTQEVKRLISSLSRHEFPCRIQVGSYIIF